LLHPTLGCIEPYQQIIQDDPSFDGQQPSLIKLLIELPDQLVGIGS